ncbi:MAG: dTDP-4-dehydrorhamnose reductase [Chloroflexota bacterium]
MRILLLGKFGQLGWELQRCLGGLGDVVALDYPEIDLRQPSTVAEVIRNVSPQVMINATAYTAVDKAESEPDLAMEINAHAVGVLAQESEAIHAAFIHYSTDYVFDGNKGSPYVESDPPNPINVYGKSKLAGERFIQDVGGSHLIFRTSWVYSLRRESFVTKVLEWARRNEVLKIVDDQVSSPTWARVLAEATALLIARAPRNLHAWIGERRGIYHLAGSGACSRYEWAQAILENDPQPESRLAREVLPAKTADFPTPAQRPLYSPLNCEKFSATFNLRLPPWQESLQLAMADWVDR